MVSRRIHDDPRRLDGLQEEAVANGARHDEVDWPLKERFEVFAQAEVSVGAFPFGERLKLDEEIDVTPLRVELVAGGRAEQLQPLHAMATAEFVDLGSVFDD